MLETRKHFCCLFLLIIVITQVDSLPPSEKISQVSFLNDQLFFLTQSKKYFGMISYETQLYTMQQEVKEDQQVLRFEPEQKYFILGKGKDKALLFRLAQLNIEEINVQFVFEHQQIIDILSIDREIYILTNKDLRIHHREQSQVPQKGRDILTSCRKNEWFMKCFKSKEKKIIVLRRDQQLCVRVVNMREKTKQKCLFNISSEVTDIDKVQNGILVQTTLTNYLIEQNLNASSFQGHISQVGNNFVTLSEQFRTFSISSKNFTSGLSVVGSTQTNHFMLKDNENRSISLYHNDDFLYTLGHERPTRAWINQMKSTQFKLVIQYKTSIEIKQIVLNAANESQQVRKSDPGDDLQL